jgi:hypothetical protein
MTIQKHNFNFGVRSLDGLTDLWHKWCNEHQILDHDAKRIPNAEDVNFDPTAYGLDLDQIHFVRCFMHLHEVAKDIEEL